MNELRAVNRQKHHTLALAKYPDAQPHWVADMSFATPAPILSALKERLEEGHFSYPDIPDATYESIQVWCKTRYDWTIDREWIVIVPNTMSGVRIGVKSAYGSGPLFLQRPNYGKLLNLSDGFEVTPHEINLESASTPFSTDDLLSIKLARPPAVVLCNPTNPTGIVSRQEELEALATCIKSLDTIIISDEAHADFILGDRPHVPAGSVKGLKEKSITVLSPSKTFNLAGISIAYAVIPSRSLREKFMATKEFYSSGINALGLLALQQGYLHCSEWLEKLIVQLKRNQAILYGDMLNTKLKYSPSEASYLAWIDARETGEDTFKRLLHNGVSVSDGHEFGSPGWIRLNFACPENQLKNATNIISGLFGNLK